MTARSIKQQAIPGPSIGGLTAQPKHEGLVASSPLSPIQRQVAHWGGVIGNAAVQRQFIQRDDAAPATAPAVPQTAPSSLDEGIRSALVAGDFAYDGFYKMDAAGGFQQFENPQLQTAMLYYRDVWLKKFEQGKKDAQQTKAAAQPVDPYARVEADEVAKIKALEGRIQTRKGQEKQIEAMYQKSLKDAKTDGQRAQLEAWRTRELGKVISVTPSADIEERWKAKQQDEAEGSTKHVDAYKADRPEREARKTVYETLIKQFQGLDKREQNLKTVQTEIDKLQGPNKQPDAKEDGGEIGEAAAAEKAAGDAFAKVASRKQDDPERSKLSLASLNAQQETKKLRQKRDGLVKFIPEEKAAIESERFQLQAQLVHLAPTLKREDTEDVKKAQAAVQQKLAEEDAQNAKAADASTGGTAPQTSTKWHDLAAEVTSTKAEDQYQNMKAETTAKPSGVVAGDTEGFNVNEHPAWFKAILPKLIGLGPQGSKGLSRAGLPAWDEDASGAQALLHAYLNAWTRWRLAENQTKAAKKAAKPGEKVTPADWHSVKIPSNLEVMNAAIGFSETNERSGIFNGLKGLMDWCGPATQKSVVLGLWKRGLMLRTEKVPQSVGNMGKIKDLITAIDAEQKAAKDENRAPNKMLIQKNWTDIGTWVKADLQKQDVFLISMYPDAANYDDWEATKKAAGIQLKKEKSKGDQEFLNKTSPKFAKAEDKRHLTGEEAATAPLYPGDFVYWVSSFEYGPMAGHVATIIEEKDRDESAKNADQKISQMRVNSGNAAGVVQGEGSVRPEGITRRVTGPLMAKSYYDIAGAGNGYYYGGLRDKYNTLYDDYHKLIAPQEKSAAARKSLPDLEKKIAALQADIANLSQGENAKKNAIAIATKQALLAPLLKQKEQKTGALMSQESETALLGSPNVKAAKKAMDDKEAEIITYKKRFKEYPVHKAPNSPADMLGANDGDIPKWADKKKDLVSSHDNSVWIVSIVRSSRLDSNKLLASESADAQGHGQKVDDESLGKQGVERMDPELLGYIKRFFGEGLGFPTLLLTEEESKANATARKTAH